ncbi:hypothetical protein ACKLNO_01905 [Neisseriaceae bacterium B1]
MGNTFRQGGDDVLLNTDGLPADIVLPDLAAAIADDVEKKRIYSNALRYRIKFC